LICAIDNKDFIWYTLTMNPTLKSFVEYYEKYPNLRFWQALQAWSGKNFILITNTRRWMCDHFIQDTYYFKGKDK